MSQHKVEQRLRQYLERDKEGIRKRLIKIFLTGGKYTIEDIFNMLPASKLNIRGISAMVGLMSSRLGILATELGSKNKYSLKQDYADIVNSVLREFEGE
ncbi:MAG: DUF2551 domain-containing protein [Archaeoglobaceae archaeon]